jgi:dimethylamine/trimethylamine dehydrogenase
LPSVEIETGRRWDADDVVAAGADVVVVATGARWAADGLNGETRGPIAGADPALPHVLTPEQLVLEGRRPPGPRVLVYDCDGYFTGPSVAELLRGEGHGVSIVTPAALVAAYADETLEGDLLRQHLHDLGIAMVTQRVVHALDAGGVRGETVYGDAFALAADGVVLVTQRRSDDALWHQLAGRGLPALYRIGDCVAPRLIADAIFDGHRLGREIDSPDPSQPVPHRRERPWIEELAVAPTG